MQKLGKLTESKEKLTKMGIQSQCTIHNWLFEKQVKQFQTLFDNNDAK